MKLTTLKKVTGLTAALLLGLSAFPLTSKAAELPSDFNEVPKYAQGTIKHLFETGKLNGFPPDRSFKPKQTITRAEFYAMLLSTGHFEEVKAGVSYSENMTKFQTNVMDKAYKAGLLAGSGYDEKGKLKVKPSAQISREEMATILVRAYGSKYSFSARGNNEIFYNATDFDEISPWAENGVYSALDLGLMKGTSSTKVSPKGKGNRTEAAILIHRLDKMLQTVPVTFTVEEEKSYIDLLLNYEERHGAKSLAMDYYLTRDIDFSKDVESTGVLKNYAYNHEYLEDGTLPEESYDENIFDSFFVLEFIDSKGKSSYVEINAFNYFDEYLNDNAEDFDEYYTHVDSGIFKTATSYLTDSRFTINQISDLVKKDLSLEDVVETKFHEISFEFERNANFDLEKGVVFRMDNDYAVADKMNIIEE